MFSVSYLLLLTAVGCLTWQRRGWILSLAASLVWTLIGLLFLGVCSEHYGWTASFASLFTHGWLELFAIFYWVYRLRRACTNYCINFQGDWSTWTDWLKSFKKPHTLFEIVEKDAKVTWNIMIQIIKGLWHQNLRRELLIVSALIFISATIETYITPSLTLSLRT